MAIKARNRVIVAALAVVGFASFAYYLHNKKQQELAAAKADAFAICSSASVASVDAMRINDTELPAIAARAGLDPNKVRLGMVSPEEGHSALSSAGLLVEWDAVLAKTRKMVKEAKEKDVQCNIKQDRAVKFLRENNALPSIP